MRSYPKRNAFLLFALLACGCAILFSACSSNNFSARPSPTGTFTAAPIPTATAVLPTAHPLGVLGNGTAQDITWSPDGKSYVVAGSLGFHFYDAQSGQLIKSLDPVVKDPAHQNDIPSPYSVAYNPDGKGLLFWDWNGLWQTDLDSGKTTRLISADIYPPSTLFYSPDGQKIVFLHTRITVDGADIYFELVLLDAKTGTRLKTLIKESTVPIYAVQLSPDDRTLAAADGDKNIYLFDLNTGANLGVLSGHESDVLDVAFSPDGRFLVSSGLDLTLRVWNATSHQILQTVRRSSSNMPTDGVIYHLIYESDGKTVLAAQLDGRFVHWAVDDQGLLSAEQTLLQTQRSISKLLVQPGGSKLATLDQTGRIEILDPSSGQTLQSLLTYAAQPDRLAWSSDGAWIAAGSSSSQSMLVWNTHTRQLVQRSEGFENAIMDLAFSPNGGELAVSDESDQIQLLDTATGKRSLTLPVYMMESVLAFSPHGDILATASYKLQLWQLSDGSLLHEMDLQDEAFSISFSPNGKLLAIATRKGVELWDLSLNRQLSSWQFEQSDLRKAVFRWGTEANSPLNGAVVALTFFDPGFSRVEFYNLQDDRLLYSLAKADQQSILDFGLSPDGRLIAWDNAVLADAASGSPIWGEQGQTWSPLAFSPDGSALAAGGDDGAIHLWDISDVVQSDYKLPQVTATPFPTPVPTPTPLPTQPMALTLIPLNTPSIAGDAIRAQNLAQLQQIAQYGQGSLDLAAWSGNGQALALSGSLGVYVYQAKPLLEKNFIPMDAHVTRLVLDQTGSRLMVSSDFNTTVDVFDSRTGKRILTLAAPAQISTSEQVVGFQFSPDRQMISVRYSAKGLLCSWNADNGQLLGCVLPEAGDIGWSADALSPDGRLAAIWASQTDVQLIDTITGQIVFTLNHKGNSSGSVVFSRDGHKLAYSSYQAFRDFNGEYTGRGQIEIWQIDSADHFSLQQTLDAGYWNTENFFFTVDGSRLILADGQSIKTLDVSSGKLVSEIPGAGDHLLANPDGRSALSYGPATAINLWQITSDGRAALAQSLSGFSDSVTSMTFIDNTTRLMAGTGRSARTLSFTGTALGKFTDGLTVNDAQVAVSPNGQFLAAANDQDVIQILQAGSGKVLRSINNIANSEANERLDGLTFSADGHTLACLGSYDTLYTVDYQTGKKLLQIGIGFPGTQLSFSPDGAYLAVSSYESSTETSESLTELAVFNTLTGQQVRGFDQVGSNIVFHPNGLQLISQAGDGTVFSLDLLSGQTRWKTALGQPIYSVAVSPDGGLLAAGGDNGALVFIDAGTGQVLTRRIAGTSSITSLTFSADGSYLATGYLDGTVRLWAAE